MLIFDIRSRGSLQRLVHSCYNSLQQIKNIPCLLSYLYVIWRSPLCLWCRENFQQYSSLLHSGPFHRTKRFTWKFYVKIVQFILRLSMKYWENKFPHKIFFCHISLTLCFVFIPLSSIRRRRSAHWRTLWRSTGQVRKPRRVWRKHQWTTFCFTVINI